MCVISPLEGCILRGGLHTLYDVIWVFGTRRHVNLELRKKLLWKTWQNVCVLLLCASEVPQFRHQVSQGCNTLRRQASGASDPPAGMKSKGYVHRVSVLASHAYSGTQDAWICQGVQPSVCAAQDFVAHFCNMHHGDNCS